MLQIFFQDTELSYQLIKQHDFVKLDSDKLSTHHTIQHLIEVDEAFVDLDSHLEYDALNIHLASRIFNLHL